MPESIDCRPLLGPTLVAVASQNLPGGLKTALAEWIDNSFDAGARHVAITFERHGGKRPALTIRDDGAGTDRLDKFLRLGDHGRSNTTRLGRFGVGSKDAALWCGGMDSRLSVASIHGGHRRSVSIAWQRFVRDNGRVEFPDPEPAGLGERGTTITVEPVDRSVPHGEDWDKLVAELGYLYSPAIHEGRQITLTAPTRGTRPEPVLPWDPPDLEPGYVETNITVAGRTAHVKCGIVPAGVPHPPTRQGLTYWHGFRVIVPASSRGCGSYDTSRVCGFVKLLSGWALSKNKDEIIGADDLYAAVEQVCRPVLEKADKVGRTLDSEAFLSSVSERVNAGIDAAEAKARRGKGDTKGKKNPTGDGSPHRKAEREQSGSRFPPRRAPARRTTPRAARR